MNKRLVNVGGLILLLLTANLQSSNGRVRKVQRVAKGTWGALHIVMEVSAESASIEYDCAHGTINGPLALDRRGRFSWAGTHTTEHGGPIRRDEKPNHRPARYTGSINGKTMTLTVTLTDTNETLGPYTLTHGNSGRVFKCK